MGERKGKPRRVTVEPLEFPKHRPKEPTTPEKKPVKKPEKVPA